MEPSSRPWRRSSSPARARATELRTLFAVGDEKQSIYSFQGADPDAVRRNGPHLPAKGGRARSRLARGAAQPLLPLDRADPRSRRSRVRQAACRRRSWSGRRARSFSTTRSARARRGWSSCGRCRPRRSRLSPRRSSRGTRSWPAPARSMRCAGASPPRSKRWIGTERACSAKAARSRAGDILILVRRRDPFTAPMIRELKRLGVTVAGADRMKLMDQLAVQDLVALADVLLMPEDDLALAVVLKSPLFGFDDDDLFTLAHDRKGSLWTALKAKANDDPRFAAAAETLVAVARPRRLAAALRILLRAARRRGPAPAQSHADQARARGGRGDRRVSRSRARPMTATPRRRCKASSISSAPATSRSSATWSSSATRCAS